MIFHTKNSKLLQKQFHEKINHSTKKVIISSFICICIFDQLESSFFVRKIRKHMHRHFHYIHLHYQIDVNPFIYVNQYYYIPIPYRYSYLTHSLTHIQYTLHTTRSYIFVCRHTWSVAFVFVFSSVSFIRSSVRSLARVCVYAQ